MPADQPSRLIAVDGGGSTCRVALLLDGQRFEAESGPANATSDPEGALANVRAALAAAAAKARLGLAGLRTVPAHVGLAGVLDPATAARIAARLPFERVRVADDRASAVVGALGAAEGAVAGIGTGSFLGRRAGGQLRLIGGWGLKLGDEASAGWLGRGLLVSALRTVDGLASPSALTEAVLAEHGGPAGIVTFAAAATPADFGRLAPRITAAAVAGDAAARALMRAGAAYLEAGLAALGWREGEAFCLIGGVAPAYAPYLGAPFARALRPPQGSGLDGALALARTFAAEEMEC